MRTDAKIWCQSPLFPIFCLLAAAFFIAPVSHGQVLSNQSLAGKYYFRHLSLGTDAQGNVTDPHSLIGAITFDGNGHYTFSGGAGTYAVDPGGFVSLDSPVRSGEKVNARLGAKILIGSATESSANSFDLFVAIPAPTTTASFSGGYWVATLELPGGNPSALRNTFFPLNIGAAGSLVNFTVSGHAADLSSGLPVTQSVTGATYIMGTDGTGTVNFGASSTLLSGNRNIFVSDDGNIVIGGTAGGADILIGVKAQSGITNASWNSAFWAAGLRLAPSSNPPDISSYSGAVTASGQGTALWTRRIKQLGFGMLDFTGLNNYSLKSDGSGTIELSQIALGAGGKAAVASAISTSDPGAFEIYLAVQPGSLSGGGVFLNPRGVTSAASFSPAGAPISPGEFIALFGTGLAKSTQTAAPPYPPTLNGVTVLINGKQAPIYSVSATQINCLVPYSTQGPTATIVVQNGANSNAVTVPVAATSPGVYALNQAGTGAGAILHTDYSLVNSSHPAAPGETVLIFLTGMGAVIPAVPDGTAGGSNPVSTTVASPVYVYVGGEAGTVLYSGLAPGFPGLYQINVTLPAFLPGSGNLPLAIQTPNAFHDQVDIAIK